MKKVLMGLMVLFLLVIPHIKVQALEDSFYEGEYISGEYIKKFRNGSGKYEQLKFFRRRSDNQFVYCIQLWEALSNNKTLPGYDYNQYDYASMDYSVWERVMLIAYYGYGYGNHTDSKWYVVTQFMIWQITSPDTNIYFTDTLNGNRIEKYTTEMNEINTLIQNHGNIPSFYNGFYQVKYNETLVLNDENQVLNNFEIFSTGGTNVQKDNSNLFISKKVAGVSSITLVNNGNLYNNSPIVYIDSGGQNVLVPGKYYPIYVSLEVSLPSSSIILKKLDQDTQSNQPQGDASLVGSKFQLLDENQNLISEKENTENQDVVFENIGYGTYYLKEIKAGIGYLQNTETIKIDVDEEIETIQFFNRVIKNEIVLKKYGKKAMTGEVFQESDAIFGFYNKMGECVGKTVTNDEGIAAIRLPYGIYTVKQEKGLLNYNYVEDFEIQIQNNNEVQTFELYNEEMLFSVQITNTDKDSNLPILEVGASFKIKDLSTDEYLVDDEGTFLAFKTNSLGKLDLITLSSGTYQLEQVIAVDGYYISTEKYIFELNEENAYLDLVVSNEKMKSQIQIDNYIEYYFNDVFIKKDKDDNILVSVYAMEDIYSKDGTLLYKKDSEVDKVTLVDGTLLSSFLVFGDYYIYDSNENTLIEIALNTVETKKVELLNKIYEYDNTLSEVGNEIIMVPNTYLSSSILTSKINLLYIGAGLCFLKRRK